MVEDFYAALGLARGASREEVQRAYRRLVMGHRSEKSACDPRADKKSVAVADAHAPLCDPERRRIVGAEHTPLSAFLTVHRRPNAGRRGGTMPSGKYLRATIMGITVGWIVLMAVLGLVVGFRGT